MYFACSILNKIRAHALTLEPSSIVCQAGGDAADAQACRTARAEERLAIGDWTYAGKLISCQGSLLVAGLRVQAF